MHHVIVSVFKLVSSFCVRERINPVLLPTVSYRGQCLHLKECLRTILLSSGHQFSSLDFVTTFAALWPAVFAYI